MPSTSRSSAGRGSEDRPRGRSGRRDRVRRLEEQVAALEARVRALEGRQKEGIGDDNCCVEDLIGCLDDCDLDIDELRGRVCDVRETKHRN